MLLDTDVLVDFLRGHSPAVQWLTNYSSPIGIPGFVAMELLQGCRDLAEQQRVERELGRLVIHWPTRADCDRAYRDFAALRLVSGLGLLDSLIAQTAIGLNEPLATFNIKHYGAVVALQIVQPY
jgi:predicted nucleic acid-binding protein